MVGHVRPLINFARLSDPTGASIEIGLFSDLRKDGHVSNVWKVSRDHDYIDTARVGNISEDSSHRFVNSPNSVNKTDNDQDSAEEYVELAQPTSRSSLVR